jgi:hypothetical protein
MIPRLPESTQHLYAELLQKVAASPLAGLSGGTFVSKVIKGARYWYYQVITAKGQVQRYIGRESEELLNQIQDAKASIEENQPILDERRRLVAMLIAGGAVPEKGRSGKILQGMADAGLFVSGGVLVGSFAFACYANMLGVQLDDALRRTEDMDFSVDRELEVGVVRELKQDLLTAVPDIKTPKQINPWVVPFNMLTPDGFQVEFLTTKNSPHEKAPIEIPRFGVHAQPLNYMDYLIEDAQQAVILYGAGIPVVVPNPARYALHKLAVAMRRPIGSQAKIKKDKAQASRLVEVLAEDNPGALMLAAEASVARSDNLAEKMREGAGALPAEMRDQVMRLLA